MTELLYLLDCYLKEFDAKIINTVQEGDCLLLELDKTAFYPRGGGQPSDTGKLIVKTEDGDVEVGVVEVFKRDNKVLHKVCDNTELLKGLSENTVVHGIIDWNRRYYFMRCHTAAHVVSAVIHKKTGALITGNNIDEEKVRIDFNLENFDKEFFLKCFDEAKKIISEGHNVKLSIMPREEAFKIPELVRLKKMLPETIKDVRVVEIEGVDTQACGGTHVKNTNEIGSLEVLKMENKGKNNRRVYFKVL